MATSTLDRLMRLSMEIGKDTFEQWNPRPAVNRWWLAGQKARRPFVQPYGKKQ